MLNIVQLVWMPPSWVHEHAYMNILVLNFSMEEWYNVDKVMRQFGCVQDVSNVPHIFDNVHKIKKMRKKERIV